MEIYNRADIVTFLNTGTAEVPVFTRMQGFTDEGTSMNAITYSRRYVDERTEREDTTGYGTSIAYTFDRIKTNAVHEKICRIHEEELVGQIVQILSVNIVDNTAKLRNYSVIPDAMGDGTDAYQYSGNFKASGEIKLGTATISNNGLTATFTENASV